MQRALMWLNLSGCETQKWPKNTKNAFFACFGAYVGQPHVHIGWTTSMPFASINPTKGRNFNHVSTPSNPAIRFFYNCNSIFTFDGTHRFNQWDFNFVSTVCTLVCSLDTHHLLFCSFSTHVQQPTAKYFYMKVTHKIKVK